MLLHHNATFVLFYRKRRDNRTISVFGYINDADDQILDFPPLLCSKTLKGRFALLCRTQVHRITTTISLSMELVNMTRSYGTVNLQNFKRKIFDNSSYKNHIKHLLFNNHSQILCVSEKEHLSVNTIIVFDQILPSHINPVNYLC